MRMIQMTLPSLEGDHLLARLTGAELPAPELAEELDRRVQERVRCAVEGVRFGRERNRGGRAHKPSDKQRIAVGRALGL